MNRRVLKLLFIFNSLALSPAILAHPAIEIVKSEGGVTVSGKANTNPRSVSTHGVLPQNNVLATGADGRAVVKVGNTGYIVLEKNSRVEMNGTTEKSGFFRQLSGAVYYAVNTIKGNERTLEVRTKTATMGIRGTRFLVSATDEHQEVGMRKGTLTVVSPHAEFEIHKQAEMDEFQAMKQEGEQAVARQQAEFQAYQDNTVREFVEFKKEFTLSADRMVSFDGQRVDDRPLSGATRQSLESLESFGAQWINQVKD